MVCWIQFAGKPDEAKLSLKGMVAGTVTMSRTTKAK